MTLIKSKSFQFPGGEINVSINTDYLDSVDRSQVYTHVAHLQSPEDLIQLILFNEILERLRLAPKRLIIPYFPYARQDRLTEAATAFSLKTVAKLINGLNFDEVVACDVHSDVTPALVNGMRVVSQFDLVSFHIPTIGEIIRAGKINAIVAPDAGAYKKAFRIACHYGLPLLVGTKVRDVSTGEITGTKLNESSKSLKCLIVDDICDGGRTFIELAKVMRNQGALSVDLYVTHGIFSKGFDVFNGLIDDIYTTNCFLSKAAEEFKYKEGGPCLHINNLNFEKI